MRDLRIAITWQGLACLRHDRVKSEGAILGDLKIIDYLPGRVLQQRTYGIYVDGGCLHPPNPCFEIKWELPGGLRSNRKSCLREHRPPFGWGVVPHMGSVSQQFDGLQVCVE
jgi:hypothetical protein